MRTPAHPAFTVVVASLTAVFVLAPLSAWAAQAPAASPQNPVLATPRNGQPIDDQAHPVTLVGRDRIDTGMLETPGDLRGLFDLLPGTRVQITSPVLGTTALRLRGLPGRYTRLLLDGTHLYGDRPGGYALLRIPLMDLGRVEIITGPAGAFYGSDSAAGAVNLISRMPGPAATREFLFSQSARNATDGVFWLSTPATGPSRTWSQTWLVDAHRQDETDVDDDGWSDLAGYARGAVRQRTFWSNGQGRSAAGVAGVTFHKREGGSGFAREALETKTADGGLSGEMTLDNGYILAGAGILFIQSRTRDFSDVRERDRLQTATIEITLRRPSERHTWLAGLAADWYAVRAREGLPTGYVSTRPGIFVHDDFTVAPWLIVSGSARLDHHNLYGLLLSPRGSALVRNGSWAARVSAARGHHTPRPLMDDTEAAGLSRLTIQEPLEVETAQSVSADVTHTTRATALSFSLFRTRIDDPAQIDRATYTLRNEADPIVSQGVEVAGTLRQAPFSVTATYTNLRTRERGGQALALTPRHSGGVMAAAEGSRGRIGVEVVVTGEQRLDANPFRSTSEPYALVGLLGEYRLGRWRLFVNGDNLTDVRQTDWDPIQRPSRDVDGRWTVDAWAPLAGRVINVGVRGMF